MKFSLINVQASTGPFVSGSWLQDHIGSLATATARARDIEAANSNKIDVAVVEELSSKTPALGYWPDLTRLDVDS
jgi:hypothetical protein